MARALVEVLMTYSLVILCFYVFNVFFITSIPSYQEKNRLFLPPNGENTQEQDKLFFVFLLPCLNEERVIGNTLKSLLELPNQNMFIIVIDDASDDNTVSVVRAMQDARIRLFQRRLPDARKGKGEALNSCFQRVRRSVSLLGIPPEQVILGVMDGDGRPSGNLVAEATKVFSDKRVGAAQAGVRIGNRDRLLPFMQDVEFSSLVSAMQNSREYLGTVGLGGNGQFTRMSALNTLGSRPWTSCLVEDFDLGVRLLLKGWQVRLLSQAHVEQQGVESLGRWIRQRARWIQGNLQCIKHLWSVPHAQIKLPAKLDLIYVLLQTWITLIGTPVQIVGWLAVSVWLTSSHYAIHPTRWNILGFGVIILLWLTLVFGPGFLWGAIYFKETNQKIPRKYWSIVLFTPVYNLLVVPSAWLAFFRYITRQNMWVKTERNQEFGTLKTEQEVFE